MLHPNMYPWALIREISYGVIVSQARISTVVLLGLFNILVILLIYQLKFHPLSRYPGPFLASLTNLYAAYHAWKGDIHLDMYKCHLKYGPFVRYAPNRLMINSTSALKTIYGHGTNTKKSEAYNALVHRTPSSFTMKDKKAHVQRRKVLSLGFSDASIRQSEGVLVSLVERFCHQIGPAEGDSEWSAPRNMGDWCSYLTFDIMGLLVFGMDYATLTDNAHRHIFEDIRQSNIRLSVLMQAVELRFTRLEKKLFPKSIKARKSVLKFIAEVLQERGKIGSGESRDVFSLLIASKDPETGLAITPDQIASETTTLIIASTDTSSTALSATFFYLCNNSNAYERACREVREKFPCGSNVRPGSQLSSCRYLRACIDEAMRLAPPVGSVLWREVQDGGLTVDGHFIPRGTSLGTAIYTLHHNPDLYPRPFDYVPERWLSDPVPESQVAFNPFSIGPRSCVAKSLALHELQLATATVLARFDFERIGPEEKSLHMKEHISSSKVGQDGPMLRFRRLQTANYANSI